MIIIHKNETVANMLLTIPEEFEWSRDVVVIDYMKTRKYLGMRILYRVYLDHWYNKPRNFIHYYKECFDEFKKFKYVVFDVEATKEELREFEKLETELGKTFLVTVPRKNSNLKTEKKVNPYPEDTRKYKYMTIRISDGEYELFETKEEALKDFKEMKQIFKDTLKEDDEYDNIDAERIMLLKLLDGIEYDEYARLGYKRINR